jgi:hypothetical protein
MSQGDGVLAVNPSQPAPHGVGGRLGGQEIQEALGIARPEQERFGFARAGRCPQPEHLRVPRLMGLGLEPPQRFVQGTHMRLERRIPIAQEEQRRLGLPCRSQPICQMEHGFDLGKLLRRQALEDTPERSVCAINGEGSLQEGSRRIL